MRRTSRNSSKPNTKVRYAVVGLGYTGFALVWVANFYMNIFGRIRLEIKRERVEISAEEQSIKSDRPGLGIVKPFR